MGLLKRVLFVMVNTYTSPKLSLGAGPLNDSVTVAYNIHQMGYDVFFLHNTTTKEFLGWLEFFFANVTQCLVVFYTGHGACLADKNGDEEDGKDEAMVFDRGYVLDDTLAEFLCRVRGACVGANPTARTILLSDCCHSGTIWDIPQNNPAKLANFPKGCVSLSAARDDQTAKQTSMDKRDQGIFTFYFWKFWNAEKTITPRAMAAKMTPVLTPFNQLLIASATSPELMNQPIFPS
jgi:hypothetical protein